MAAGDDAAAAGYTVQPGTIAANTIDTAMALIQDDLANKTGTKGQPVPVAKGGTNATTAAAARTSLGVDTAITAAITAANPYPPSAAVTANTTAVRGTSGRLLVGTPVGNSDATTKLYVDSVAGGTFNGGVVTGEIYLPNSTAATSGYTVAYINGDGRISRGASTERVKKYISQIEPSVLGDIFPDLFRFQMRNGDGSWTFGYIAERLAESEALAPFVVWETTEDGERVPLSIDFIALLICQVSQLHARQLDFEARLAALEAR